MTVRDFLLTIRARWRIILATFLVVAATGTVLAALQPSQYTSTSTLYVASRTDESAGAAYQGSLLSEQRVKSYTDLINTDRVRDAVISDLRLSLSRSALSNKIEATSQLDSVLITIDATDESPIQARELANSAAREAVQLINSLEAPPPGQVAPIELKLVEEATIPDRPSSPPTWLVVLAVLIASMVVAVTGGVIREYFDQSLKGASEVREIVGRPTLSEVPAALAKNVLSAPDPAFLEAFRRLRANLQFVQVELSNSSIVVTSSIPGEGKSTVSRRLGDALCAAGFRVVVVDADMRRGTLSRDLGVEAAVGLSTLIVGRANLDQALQRTSAAQFDVIATGVLPPNPSELLSSARMLALVRDLHARYDYVLFDTPPILPATDAAVLASICGGVLLVFRSNMTSRGDAQKTVERLHDVSANVLGSVLNDVARPRGHAYSTYESPPTPERSVAGRQPDISQGTQDTAQVAHRGSSNPVPGRRS